MAASTCAAIPNPSNPGLRLEFVDDWQDPSKSFTRTGGRRRYQFILSAGIPELRICLAYTDAPARALQNNLNLIVQNLTTGQKCRKLGTSKPARASGLRQQR